MISVTTTSTPTPDGAAKLVAQITTLVDSYMIWLGSTTETSSDDQAAIQSGRLCTDWACAMTGNKMGTVGTSLSRGSGSSDVALAMSQRIAKRIGKAVFLSVDVSPEHLLAAEKWIIRCLKDSKSA